MKSSLQHDGSVFKRWRMEQTVNHKCMFYFVILRNMSINQGSHYILVLKFKDFSRTFKDPEVAFSRTNS